MLDEKNFCVYRHTSPSGKVYIGITCQNPIRRWAHGHGYRNNSHFQRAIQKYGWDNFTHEILYSQLSKADACDKEIELIRLHRSNEERYGYNISSGGQFPGTGHHLSEDAKRKLSESKRGENHPYYGKHLSEEHRKKMSDSHKGYKPSPEECKQRSERQMGKKNHNYGKCASEETRRKMSESKRLYSVAQLSMDGEVIRVFHSVSEVVKTLGCSKTSITDVCSGRRQASLGYKWMYLKY